MSNIYKFYKNLLDVKLKNSAILIFIIANLIILVWIFIPNSNANLLKANILELPKKSNLFIETSNIIIINWKKYKVILQEIN